MNLQKNTMKNFLLTIGVLLNVIFAQAQWSQVGLDILGDGPFGDQLGRNNSIAIDSTGNTIAVGAAYNSNLFPYSGYARVLDWDGLSWIQRGADFIGTDVTYEATGYAVDLSSDGMTVAVSSPWGYNSLGYKCGNVRVFDWSGAAWIQRGFDIGGEGNAVPSLAGDVFGWSLQLSSSGDHLVVGAPSNTAEVGVQQLQGHARVFHWSGTSWGQLGQDIDGPFTLGTGEFGFSVSINDNGNRVAVGGRSYTGLDPSDQDIGMAIVLDYNGSEWVQIGDTIFGSSLGDQLGSAIQMAGDGNTIAIGSPGANNFGGVTQIFDWNDFNWIQRGLDIVGTSSSLMTRSGTSLGISNNGDVLVIGDPGADFNVGATKVFQWNGNLWQQISNTIVNPGTSSVALGNGVRINFDGSKVIVGSPYDGTGKVQVFENNVLVNLHETNLDLSDDELIQIVDQLGRNVKEKENIVLFYIYKSGRVERKFIIK
ncbi:MAG: hypothetical protein ACJAU0_001043 [Flavobacteriales bacterium]|jgi:hypothetical protein